MRLPEVIFKVDDYGNLPGEQAGICSVVKAGSATDVAVMVNLLDVKGRDKLLDAVTKSPLNNRIGIGILLHTNVLTGYPVSNPDQVRSLINNEGRFIRPSTYTMPAWIDYLKQVKQDHLKREINAQIERFYQQFGDYPDALDSHNIILSVPPAEETAIKIAQELKIPISYPKLYSKYLREEGPFHDTLVPDKLLWIRYRQEGVATADHALPEYWNSSETLSGSLNRLLQALSSLEPGITEFLFHPGYPYYSRVVTEPRYERGRVRDFRILTNPRLKNFIQPSDEADKKVELTSYKRIRQIVAK